MFKKGVTLIECLVAISILIIGVLSAFVLVTRSLSTAPLIADNFSAALYSQQGIEAIIKLRNDNWLQNKRWDSGLSGSFCVNIESNGSISTSPSSIACSIGNTKFSRLINIIQLPGNDQLNDQLKVTSTVNWQSKGQSYGVTTTTYLYNWAKEFFPSS